MKEILLRLLLAALLIFATFALPSPPGGRHADLDPNPASLSHRQQENAQSLASNDGHKDSAKYSAGDDQTQGAFAFTRHIMDAKPSLVLMDPATKIIYQLDDQSRVRRLVGSKVRVIGRLDMTTSNTHIDVLSPTQ